MGASMAIISIRIAVIMPNTPAAPRPAAKFFCTITNPLASAKSAMHQMANQTMTTKERM